ncbi:GAF domain-containing sensor histidine kinase [Thermomonospora curvata]|uniref:Histidine kinase n=1 Tax=Thermomonospora curvata (strain ATCC 19995 / DSM 43183 / JCM 3096 / KCTC 9072 / NBRC 15933 / NCIMB 10081 / Henssen B9) TaxID=471852 RepID=D1ABJ2_THECD|nr:GAF domain-containing sensor histidine kinase [Thermomonospora curvata]ACY97228.1 histidine kinase [Thermomonospora curvata DSM 43183]
MTPLELLAGRGSDLLVRIVTVACSDRVLPDMAVELAGLVVRSAADLPFCDVYVLDEEERALECPGREPVPLGEGDVGWVAAHGRPRRHADGRGAALPVLADRRATIAVIDVRSAGPCRQEDLDLVTALAALFAPVLHSCRRLRNAQEREHSAERFAERAVEVQEAERARLVRDIHDGIAQRLASLGFHLSACEQALAQGATAEAQAQLGLARELCDLAAAETRAAIGGLRPPVLDDLGLTAALATLAREAGSRQPSLDVTVTVSGELEDALPDHIQTALYRIAQEAVGNCLRHAKASVVHVLLEHDDDRVRLRVSDDGVGFSIQDVFAAGRRPDSYGLRGMSERAELLGGRVHISSRPGGGTTVEALVPLRRA